MVEDEIGKYDSYGDFLIKLHRLILEKDSWYIIIIYSNTKFKYIFFIIFFIF